MTLAAQALDGVAIGQNCSPGTHQGQRLLDGPFVVCGIIVMVLFVRSARRIEPFVADEHRPVRR